MICNCCAGVSVANAGARGSGEIRAEGMGAMICRRGAFVIGGQQKHFQPFINIVSLAV